MKPTAYISRTLVANKGTDRQETINETEVAAIDAPIVVLGEPGSGKTRLTEALASTWAAPRVTAGTFLRTAAPTQFQPQKGGRIIIDGLDEYTSAAGGSVVNEVLRKLSALASPNFVLSCRTADWQGATDRYRIQSDYGVDPVTLHIEPLSRQEARQLLNEIEPNLDAEGCLRALDEKGLTELWGNPLSLTLIGKVVSEGGGLPSTKAELLGRAVELLVQEENPAHGFSAHAQASEAALIEAAGAVFAHLLISNSTGLFVGPTAKTPGSYFVAAELEGVADQDHVQAVLKTRLFRSEGEGLLVPVHRVVAEYLAARWIAGRLESGTSRRRVFQLLTFAGGVPTALRGLHAWLAHFEPNAAPFCIANDPYGVLRYGEPGMLSVPLAKALLEALCHLANEDPYFRTEDWGGSAARGLARPELKNEIVEITTSPGRHFHLSSLILKAIPGSAVASEIQPELEGLVRDARAAFAERSSAADALTASTSVVDLPGLVADLLKQDSEDSKRLAVEIITDNEGKSFSAEQIAEAYLTYEGVLPTQATAEDDDDREARVVGVGLALAIAIPPPRAGLLLDAIRPNLPDRMKALHWAPRIELRSLLVSLLLKALQAGVGLTPERVWAWLQMLDHDHYVDREDTRAVADFFAEDSELRRGIQLQAIEAALQSNRPDVAAAMAVFHDLPRASRGLNVTLDDAVHFLADLEQIPEPTPHEVERWRTLVRSQQTSDGFAPALVRAVQPAIEAQPAYRKEWEALNAPATDDWREEERQRERRREAKRLANFEKHRADFAKDIALMRAGTEFGPLYGPARAYLRRFSDLDNDAPPRERLVEWLGEEIADAALAGLVKALEVAPCQTAAAIAACHAEGKEFNSEAVLKAGAIELLRSGGALGDLPQSRREAMFAAWWPAAEAEAEQAKFDIGPALEATLFVDEAAIERLLRLVIEPQLQANKEHVSGLHRVATDPRFTQVSGRLALEWLNRFPDADERTQFSLIEIALETGVAKQLVELATKRVVEGAKGVELARRWHAVLFLLDLEGHFARLSEFARSDREFLWAVSTIVRRETFGHQPRRTLSLPQQVFIVSEFAVSWPPVPRPSGGWGSTHPSQGADLVQGALSAIAGDPSAEASQALDQLSGGDFPGYADAIKHARARQRRLRRDKEYAAPSIAEVREAVTSAVPTRIDDLKAAALDELEDVANYIRNGETKAWSAFWVGTKPLGENDCRDRLIDLLRSRFSSPIEVITESRMPEEKRADVLILSGGTGLPIEVKGQWNPEVWNASIGQLDELYARDYRANGRGLYLVFWHGPGTSKPLTSHPQGLAAPNSADDLRSMLLDRIPEEDRARLDVVVIDVSLPPAKQKAA